VICYRIEEGAIVLNVRLTPRAGRDSIDGVVTLADGRVFAKAHVRAAPEDGEANKALIALLARTFRVPRSAVEIVSGKTARLKQVRIAGYPPELTGIVEIWQAAS